MMFPDDPDARRLAYLDAIATDPPPDPDRAINEACPSGLPSHSRAYLAIPPLELRRRGHDAPPVNADHVWVTMEHVRSRADCADFGLHALLHLRHRYAADIDASLRDAIDETLRRAVYWFDDAPTDCWFSTENHQVLYAAAEYLAGDLLADDTFTVTGKPGTWHRDRARGRLDRWLDWRARFGWSEWLSNQYYDENALALLLLAEYAPDDVLRRRARDLVNVLLYELAVDSFDGALATTHGRAYADALLDPALEPVAPLCYLGWGTGDPPQTVGLAALVLATVDHDVPDVIRAVGRDDPPELVHRERHGLDVGEAAAFGVNPASPDDTLFFWGQLVMGHRDVAETALSVCPRSYRRRHAEIAPAVCYHREHADGPDYTPDPNNTALTRAEITTYRTPACSLSCVQDYRPGKFGFQQHVWQASLGDRAVVFTNHPQAKRDDGMATYWGRNGVLPRAASHRNVCVSLYRVGDPPYEPPAIPGFDASLAEQPFTHAYVPRFAFDEWVECGDWVCGRRGDGYLAIGTPQPTNWAPPTAEVCDLLGLDEPTPYDLVAAATDTAWVCEVGRREEHGSFDRFVDAVSTASLSGDAESMTYTSPSLGRVTFGWDEPFTVDGDEVSLTGYPRYDGPYCTVPFGETAVSIEADGEQCLLDPGTTENDDV
ncbi:hypothetical protein [Haloarchaeobius sp. DFWS5]|uniref:hypothetical protein n=1 Tax=Haloarchaeobius sp. DFWS5 TaxID=3446114 RepID=UPI003EBF817E